MDALLSRRALALRLNIAPHTLAIWAIKGFGPPVVKVGRLAMYDQRDVADFIEERKRPSTSAQLAPVSMPRGAQSRR